jgi:transcriptional regulator with XRE-family HTH domain
MLESKEMFEKILKTRNLTIYRLSKLSGIPKTTLVDLANGTTSIYKASLKTINTLANTLNITVEDLLNGKISTKDDLNDLPIFLKEAIEKMEKSWIDLEQNNRSSLWDCHFCELQSEINIAEVERIISSERAWELRIKYLRINRGE